MTNLEKYNKAFVDTFEINEDILPDLKYKDIPAWNSIGHMALIVALEETFDIVFDTDDIMDFKSYKQGKEILAKDFYGVEF